MKNMIIMGAAARRTGAEDDSALPAISQNHKHVLL